MDDLEKLYFCEELHEMSVKLTSFSEDFDTKKRKEMSAQLASMVAHLDGHKKSPVGQPLHTEQIEIKRLVDTANSAQSAWDLFISKVVDFTLMNNNDYMRKKTSDLMSFADDTLESAPMDNSLPWGIYAANPKLPSRLALIMSAQSTLAS